MYTSRHMTQTGLMSMVLYALHEGDRCILLSKKESKQSTGHDSGSNPEIGARLRLSVILAAVGDPLCLSTSGPNYHSAS